MPSLFHTLNVGSEALYATRQGVDTTGHNIANAQTPGYSRQRVNISQREPLEVRNLIVGNGVYVGGITRSHDKFIEKQINIANQDVGDARARADAMKVLEVIFSPELSASVSDEMTHFFNGLQDLAAFPEDFTVRTAVVEHAKNLTTAFRRVDADLKNSRDGLNEKVMHLTDRVSTNLKQIANLNIKIQTMEVGQAQEANDLRDQRDRLLRAVTEDIDVNYYEDKNGMLVIRGPKEVTLVEAGNAAVLDVAKNADNGGMYDVMWTDWEGKSSRNLTDASTRGSLGALLDVRDNVIPDLTYANNDLAWELQQNFNAVHRQGFGLKNFAEQTGRNFFKPATDFDNAAAQMELDDVIYETPNAIAAASSPLAPGDNVIMNQLVKLKDLKLMGDGDTTFQEHYANYVGALGLTVVRADHVKEATELLLDDLNKRREAVSGVSLDEEATNLLKWQTCFTANSKVITTVDEMLETVLSLKR